MNENITAATATTATETGTPKGKPRRRKYYKNDSFKVTDEYLLYAISDAGLLYLYLHGVNVDKDGNRAFYFDKCEDIKEVIDKYNRPQLKEGDI